MVWPGTGIGGTGMGDDFPAGYSLNQGGWGWGGWFGGSGNPYMDIFAVTMANFRFQNYSAGGSIFGGGMAPWVCNYGAGGGGGYDFSTSGSGSSGSTKKTAEEKKAEALAKDSLKNKHKALKDILTKYLNTLDKNNEDREEYKSLEYDLNTGYKAVTQENYDKLKEYYNTNKDRIKTALNKTDDWKKVISVGDGKYFDNKTSITTTDVLDGDSLKSDIDVMELMGDFGTKKISGFFYKDSKHNEKQKENIRKVNKAIYKALKSKVDSLKGSSELSSETKAALEKTLTICSESDEFYADKTSKPYKACTAMYYWLRIAQAEILDNKYASLNEDFSGDALLGKGSAVAAVKKDLHNTEDFSKDGWCAKQSY